MIYVIKPVTKPPVENLSFVKFQAPFDNEIESLFPPIPSSPKDFINSVSFEGFSEIFMRERLTGVGNSKFRRLVSMDARGRQQILGIDLRCTLFNESLILTICGCV